MLRVLARLFEPLTLVGLTLSVTIVASMLFAAVALLQMFQWRKRARAGSEQAGLGRRVICLRATWGVITATAAAVVAAIAYVFAAALNVPTDGTLLLTAAVVGPLPVLGVGATAVVESVYERTADPGTEA